MPKILKDTYFQEFKARYQFSKSKLVCKFNFKLFLTLPVPSLNIFGFGFCILMVVRNLKPGSLDLTLRPSREHTFALKTVRVGVQHNTGLCLAPHSGLWASPPSPTMPRETGMRG